MLRLIRALVSLFTRRTGPNSRERAQERVVVKLSKGA